MSYMSTSTFAQHYQYLWPLSHGYVKDMLVSLIIHHLGWTHIFFWGIFFFI